MPIPAFAPVDSPVAAAPCDWAGFLTTNIVVYVVVVDIAVTVLVEDAIVVVTISVAIIVSRIVRTDA